MKCLTLLGRRTLDTICENWKTAWKSLMQNHVTTSHKENQCCKNFESPKELGNHIFENHMKYHCLICEDIFPSYEQIKEHMKSEHNMPFACKGCHVFYESNSDFLG